MNTTSTNSIIKQKINLYLILLIAFSLTPFTFGGILFMQSEINLGDAKEVQNYLIMAGVTLGIVSYFLQSNFFAKDKIAELINAPKDKQNLRLQDGLNPEKALEILNSLSDIDKALLSLLNNIFLIFIILLVINESVSMMGLLLGMQGGGVVSYIPFGLVHLVLNVRIFTFINSLLQTAKEAYRG